MKKTLFVILSVPEIPDGETVNSVLALPPWIVPTLSDDKSRCFYPVSSEDASAFENAYTLAELHAYIYANGWTKPEDSENG